MTVRTIGQNQTIKLPVPDAALAVDGAQGDEQGNAALFAGLMAQLTNSNTEAQGSGDEQPADADAAAEQLGPAANGAAAEEPGPDTGASVLPAPAALQALLANALSNIVQDVKQETQLNAADGAGTGSDVLKLAQLIAKSAQKQDAVSPGAVAADDGKGTELKGITATLEAWADGPYAVAAPTTGAKEKRPMELSVVKVETHFAPVLAAEAAVPAELKAKATALPAEFKRLATSTAVKADETSVAADETAVTAGPAAGVKVETGAKPHGDGNTDTASRGKPAALPDATETVTSNTAPVTIEATQTPGQPVPVVKQIANDIASAVQGESPATLQSIDIKPGLSKLKVLHIQLQPESLGTVTVKLALRGDTLEVHIDAARAETADLIRRDRDVLSSLLRAVGYRADDAQIIVTHGDPSVAATLTTSSDGSLGSSQSGAQSGSPSGSQQSGSQQSGSQQSGSQAAGERSANSQGRDGSGNRRERGEDGTSRERDVPGARRTEAAGIYL